MNGVLSGETMLSVSLFLSGGLEDYSVIAAGFHYLIISP